MPRSVKVIETFTSIQGESSFAGKVCFFIRLAGCNLRCKYCDTEYAREEGKNMEISDLMNKAEQAKGEIIEITGGEPLLQENFPVLANELKNINGKTILVETNGSRDISAIPKGVIAVVDVKCPGSGECGSFDTDNLGRLRENDEIKFVLSDRHDYEWARTFLNEHNLTEKQKVFFSPVHGILNPARLAKWIMEDGLKVRLGIQLHKLINLP
mgnify:CR=1 FL=1